MNILQWIIGISVKNIASIIFVVVCENRQQIWINEYEINANECVSSVYDVMMLMMTKNGLIYNCISLYHDTYLHKCKSDSQKNKKL